MPRETSKTSATQLTTPPDSLKRRPKGRETTLNLKPKINQISPFRNATITKFSGPNGKEPIQLPTPSLIQHKQITTTEQQLSLSKSTLEKLSAFRYKPQISNKIATIETLSTDARSKEACQSPWYPARHNQSYFSSCADPHRSCGDSTYETVENFALTSDNNPTDAQSTRYGHYSSDQARKIDLPLFESAKEVITEICEVSSDAQCNVELHSNNYGYALKRDPELLPYELSTNTAKMMLNICPHLTEGVEMSADHFEYDVLPIPPGRHLEADRTIESGRSFDSVAVEQSYPDGYGIVSGHISRDMYTNNAFDEGLHDIDLLEITLEPGSPNTLPGKMVDTGHKPQTPDTPQSALHTHSNVQKSDYLILTANVSRDENITYGHSVTGIVLEVDDPFGMGEEEEEELLKLAQVPQSTEVIIVTEGFAPSTSVQGAICTGYKSDEVYDSALPFSPPKFRAQSRSPKLGDNPYTINHSKTSPEGMTNFEPPPGPDEEDWSFVQSRPPGTLSGPPNRTLLSAHRPLSLMSSVPKKSGERIPVRLNRSDPTILILDDRHEHEQLQPFARPVFPKLIPDRSPVVELSANSFLRVCFRIGEMYREGSRCCTALGGDAVIELFARVGFSSREPGTIKQHFQFLDLWHDRPPIAPGILGSYRTTALAESESKVFLDGQGGKMARCLGRLKRDSKSNTGWLLHIINIRETDWEEIRWTRRIVSGDYSS